jgi:hypothetical protein
LVQPRRNSIRRREADRHRPRDRKGRVVSRPAVAASAASCEPQQGRLAAAYDLLQWWGHKAAVRRGGKWAQLAKILAGDRTVDLFDHLREFKRSPGPTVEKLRGADSIVYRTRRR